MYTSIYGDYIKNKMGVELAADGEFFGKSKLGFAFSFRGNNTSYGGRIGSISVFNIGLNVAYSTMLSQRWRFTYAFGPGAGFFVNSEGSKMGFNIMGRMSAEYMLTPTFGIGADMIGSTLWLGKPKGVEMPDGESYGVARAGVMIGARLYY